MGFGPGPRQWTRATLAWIKTATTILGQNELLVDDAGGVYGGDGTTQIKNLRRAVRTVESGIHPVTGHLHASAYGISPSATGTANSSAFSQMVADAASLNAPIRMDVEGDCTFASGIAPNSRVVISGVSPLVTRLQFSGSGRFLDFSSISGWELRNLTITLTNTSGACTALYVGGSFGGVCDNVVFRGGNTAANPNANQTFVELRNNSGDNAFRRCLFQNGYRGVATSTQQNYFEDCNWTNNRIQIHGDDASFNAGIHVTGGTIGGQPAFVDYAVKIDGNSGYWWFTGVWAEGSKYGVQIGDATNGGPSQFTWIAGKIAGTFSDMNVVNGRQTTLNSVILTQDALFLVPTATVSSGGATAPAAGASETWTVSLTGNNPFGFPAAPFRLVDTAMPGEIVEVTAVSGTSWTVTRGVIGNPVAHASGFTVRAAPYELRINPTTAAHGVAVNLESAQQFDFPLTMFPPNWQVTGRITNQLSDSNEWNGFVAVTQTGQAVSGWSAAAFDNSYPMCLQRPSAGAQGNTISWDLHLSRGSWELMLAHQKGTNRGIFTVAIDGTAVGTVDAYNNGPLTSFDKLTGITIARSGVHRVTLTMASKNANATAYYGTPSFINLTRLS